VVKVIKSIHTNGQKMDLQLLTWLRNNLENFQLRRFTTIENTAKTDSHCKTNRVTSHTDIKTSLKQHILYSIVKNL